MPDKKAPKPVSHEEEPNPTPAHQPTSQVTEQLPAQLAPASTGQQGQHMLIHKLKGMRIPTEELRGRFSEIMGRWNSEETRATVTEQELRDLISDIEAERAERKKKAKKKKG